MKSNLMTHLDVPGKQRVEIEQMLLIKRERVKIPSLYMNSILNNDTTRGYFITYC